MNHTQETRGRSPLARPVVPTSGLLQRACDCGQHKSGGGSCSSCAKREQTYLLRAASNHHGGSAVPSIVRDVLRSPGSPLEATTRSTMEGRFGGHAGGFHAAPQSMSMASLTVGAADSPLEHEADSVADHAMHGSAAVSAARPDFSAVRIHTDARAGASARAVHAKAYTVGNHIVFASGRYAPGTYAGDRLLAHELAHTLQQSGATSAQLQRTIGDGHDLSATRFALNVTLEAAFDDELLISVTSNRLGPHVRLIQDSLLEQGYTLPQFGADGIYGAETKAAIEQYQRDTGAIDVDGIVGPETMGLLDTHDLTNPGNVAPPARTGPVPGPRPAPAVGCNAPFAGVTFTLAGQTGVGNGAAAAMPIGRNPAGLLILLMQGVNSVRYSPSVTIAAPSDAIAQQFEVGFIQNLLSVDRFANYTNTSVVRTVVPTTPIKDGAPQNTGLYHTIFVQTAAPRLLENFTGRADTRAMRFIDNPADNFTINLLDNPSCTGPRTAATMTDMRMRDTFRLWLAVRHQPSGCVRTLHHIDWDLLWTATVNTAGAAPTRTITNNRINVTTANGDGTPPFIQGGRVPGETATKVCV